MNNAFDNLQKLTKQAHQQHHNVLGLPDVKFTCPQCGKEFTRSGRYVRDKMLGGQEHFYCCKAHSALNSQAGTRGPNKEYHGTSTGYNVKKCRCDRCTDYKRQVHAGRK